MKSARAAARRTARATPMPMPALAPVERVEEIESAEAFAGPVVVVAVVLVSVVEAVGAGMVLVWVTLMNSMRVKVADAFRGVTLWLRGSGVISTAWEMKRVELLVLSRRARKKTWVLVGEALLLVLMVQL